MEARHWQGIAVDRAGSLNPVSSRKPGLRRWCLPLESFLGNQFQSRPPPGRASVPDARTASPRTASGRSR